MKHARESPASEPAGHADAAASRPAPQARPTLAERAAFVALVAVLCARGLMPETFEPVELSFLDADTLAGGPTLFSIAMLDLLLLVAAALVLAPARTLSTAAPVAALAVGLLVLSVVVSTAAAADHRVAANAGAHLVTMTLAGFALARLTRHRALAHLALAAVLATGGTNAVKCFAQRGAEFQQTLEEWNARKQQLLAAGYAADDPLLVNFERRIRSAETFGYHYHPNIAASSLMMALLAAAGAAAALLMRPQPSNLAAGATSPVGEPAHRRADLRAASNPPPPRAAPPSRAPPTVVLLGVCATLLAALPLTGSAGALVALLVGAAVLGLLFAWRDRVAHHHRRRVVALGGVYLAAVAVGGVWGISHGTLPHSSLAFRWQYWTASIAAYAEAPLTGLGRENFGDAYLRHKSAAAVEEVRNPHNLWLSLLVELGPAGLLAGALLALIAASAALPKSARAAATPSSSGAAVTRGSAIELATPAEQSTAFGGPVRATAMALVVAVAVVHALFAGAALQVPAVAIVWSVELVGVWAFALVACAWAIGFVQGRAHTTVLCLGVFAALAASLVHGLVDFALLTPAGLACFVSLAAIGAGLAPPRMPESPHRAVPGGVRVAWPWVFAAACVLFLLGVVAPTYRAEVAAAALRASLQQARSPGDALARLAAQRAAATADPWSAAGPRLLARLALQVAGATGGALDLHESALRLAADAVETAERRNPASLATRRVRATLADARRALAEQRGDAAAACDLALAAAQQRSALVAAYPTNPRLQLEAGEAWMRFVALARGAEASTTRSATSSNAQPARLADVSARAREHLRAALRIDDTRGVDEVNRLRPAERERTVAALRSLGEAP